MSSNVERFGYYEDAFAAFRSCIAQLAMGRDKSWTGENNPQIETTMQLMLEAKIMDPDWHSLPVEIQDQYHRLFAQYGNVGYVRYQDGVGLRHCRTTLRSFRDREGTERAATRRAFSDVTIRKDVPEIHTVLADFAQRLFEAGIETERVFSTRELQLPRLRHPAGGLALPYVKILPSGVIAELLPDLLTVAYPTKLPDRKAATR